MILVEVLRWRLLLLLSVVVITIMLLLWLMMLLLVPLWRVDSTKCSGVVLEHLLGERKVERTRVAGSTGVNQV